MSFDVFLIPSSASPTGAAYDQQMVAAAKAAGARDTTADGGDTPDGVSFELYGGGDGVQFALHSVSLGLCKVVFEVAKRTQSYVVSTGDVSYAVQIKGMRGREPRLDMPVKTMATPEELCVPLRQGYGSWAGFATYAGKRVNPK